MSSTETVRGGETSGMSGGWTVGRAPGSSGQGNRSGAETVGSTEKVGRDPGDIGAYTMRKKGSLDPDDFPGFEPDPDQF